MKKRILPTATIDEILSWNPCSTYGRDRLTKLFGRRKNVTALDILGCKSVPVKDRFWVVLRNHFLDDKALRLWAADCARHVLHFFAEKYPEDKRPREAIEAARRFARGEITLEQMTAAGAAAWATAWATWAAAGDAAEDAARAAGAAAWATARASWVAAGATWAAAGAAAWAAEQRWQIVRLKAYVKGKA